MLETEVKLPGWLAVTVTVSLVIANCRNLGPRDLQIDRVQPNSAASSTGAWVDIEGYFPVRGHVSYQDRGESSVDATFQAFLDDVPLGDVRYVNKGLLTAFVPGGLVPGVYDLLVRRSADVSDRLLEAFRVLDDATLCAVDLDCVRPCYSQYQCLDQQCQWGPADKDSDGDGSVDSMCDGGDDCDDEPDSCGAACHPSASEVCDGFDNDCDNAVDNIVTTCPHSSCDVRACYRFEEGNGATELVDDSYYGNNGTMLNVTFVTGIAGLAASMDAASDLRVPDGASLDVANGITMEAWVFVRTIPAVGRAGIIDHDGQYGFFLQSDGTLACSASLPSTVTTPPVISASRWTHLACTYDGANLKVFVDGLEVASVGVTGTIATGPVSDTVIGGNSPSGERLDGMIDEARIWSSARSAADLCAEVGACP